MTERRCPSCRSLTDDQTCVDTKIVGIIAPEPGAFSVCVYCGKISIFTDDLNLRLAGFDDLVNLEQQQIYLLGVTQRWVKSLPQFGQRNRV